MEKGVNMRLSDFIVQNSPIFIAEWTSFATTLPGCREMSIQELEDHALGMLLTIAADLDRSQTAQQQKDKSQGRGVRLSLQATSAEEHGSARHSQKFGVIALVAEFRALRASVVRHWLVQQTSASSTELEELIRFNEAIDQAVAESVAQFVGEVEQAYETQQRKLAEESKRVKQNEQTFSDLVERAPYGIYIVNAQLRITHMNAGSQAGAFHNVRPAIGRDLADALVVIWPEPIASQVLSAFQHTLDSGEPYFSTRFVSSRADIDMVESYEWQLHRIALPNGQYGVVCYYFDSTKLREAEEALRDVDRRKDQFLATLAHELRNPLAPIVQGARIASSPTAAPSQIDWSLKVIDRQATKMALLLDDLLDVSRITRGRLELHVTTLDIRSVVQSTLETTRPHIDARRHILDVSLPENALQVQGDPLRLSQIFSNLLSNAAKYTEPGGRIRLCVVQREKIVEISVADNGIGLAPDQLDTVFEMFAQGSAPAHLREGGLGVGLALARGLVELHGGVLEARSAGIGRGAEFVVRLPLTSDVSAVESPKMQKLDWTANGQRVLVIDDNADAADSLTILLRLLGHTARTAHNGEEALATVRTFHPTVVLLDLGMPRVDGYEVARRLRALEGGSRLILVALTGWGQIEDRQRTAVAGFDYHLTKPLNEEALAEIFAKMAPPSSREE